MTVYLVPVDLDDIGFPTNEIPFLANDTQFATFFNLIIECINALRLCGSVTVPTPQGTQNPDGTYPRPLSRTSINFPDSPLPYFGNHVQQARIRNFFVDAVNSLRRCYLAAGASTTQGTSIDGAVYLAPQTIASIGFPDVDIPAGYFRNDTQGYPLYNYLIDALNRVRACCSCATIGSGTTHVSALSSLRIRGDDWAEYGTGTAEYDAFAAQVITDPNYANGITPSGVNSPSPAEFDDYNFDWDTNAPGTRRSVISQVDWNGGHRSIKSIKTTEDPFYQHHFFEIIANGSIGGSQLKAVWSRQVFRFSSNYFCYDPADCNGRGILLVNFQQVFGMPTLDCGVWNKGMWPQFTPADGDDILQASMSRSGGSGDTADLGTMTSLLYTGTVRELVCFCGQPLTGGVPDPTKLRMAAWLGEAGTLTSANKVYDVTLTGVASELKIGRIWMFRHTDPHILLSGSAMCLECLEWEIIDAVASSAHNNPYNLDT